MPAVVMTGKATVETVVGALSTYAGLTNESAKAAHAWEEELIKDALGYDQTWVGRNEHIMLDVVMKPTGTTKSAANSGCVFLAPYTKVTLSGFDLSWINADWQYVGGSTIDLTDVKHGSISVRLRHYADATQNTAATTPAT